MNRNTASLAYADLQPQDFLDALENLGFRCNGRLLALNSYENRVYQVGLEEAAPLVAKFYRRARPRRPPRGAACRSAPRGPGSSRRRWRARKFRSSRP